MKWKISICAITLILVAVAFFLISGTWTGTLTGREKEERFTQKTRLTKKTHDKKLPVRVASEKDVVPRLSETEEAISAKDQRVVDEIQSALDDESFDAVKRLAAMSQNSSTAEVRQKAVDALEWFGEQALPELVPFLADADEDVRSSAMNAVEQALMQIEDEGEKARHIESLAMVKGACNESGLAMLSGQLNSLSDSTIAVATAVRIITSNANPSAVNEMKEVYRFHTEENYTTPEAAEKWLEGRQVERDGE